MGAVDPSTIFHGHGGTPRYMKCGVIYVMDVMGFLGGEIVPISY